MKHFIYKLSVLFILGSSHQLSAQITLKGKVVDKQDRPIKGASVYLDNTIDGATTDSLGQFTFTTTELGNQSLVATEVGHGTMGTPITLQRDTADIVLRMLETVRRDLEEVTITAGSFDATNERTKTVLKPLDIVTTAGAGADVVKAIQTLPGTQQNGTENGLFVRGGDASEAAVIVDGMIVQNAFFSGGPGVSTRSRFGAFSFQGVSFSSGGYSAKYSQALSGVLELNTTDNAEKSNVNLGISMGGLNASATKAWKNSSLDVGGGYSNLTPFFKLATANFNFYKVPVGGSGNVRYVWRPNKSGIFKAGFNMSRNTNGIAIPNPFAGFTDTLNPNSGFNRLGSLGDTINFGTLDENYLTSVSYKQMFKTKFSLYTAASFSLNHTKSTFGDLPIDQLEHRAQFRIEGKYFFTGRMNLLVGTDIQNYGIDKDVFNTFNQNYIETLTAGYAELEYTPIYWLAFKPGLRAEHSALLNEDHIAPRLSAAIRTSRRSQISVATGLFYQNATSNYLIAGHRPSMQRAAHLIANWQYMKNDRTFRLEGYYKDYQHLIREPFTRYVPNRFRNISDTATLWNNGYGYAQGMELFWRDKKSIKNADYWISYSYIDTRRLYEQLIYEATPTFIATHNLNLVGKYFVTKWNTSISATYTYSSGYPYYNPEAVANAGNFLSDRTPAFNNVALQAAYLHTFGRWFSVFFISIDNVLNTKNVFGYRYSFDASGNVIPGSKKAVVPSLYRTIFVGANFSLSQFKKDEL